MHARTRGNPFFVTEIAHLQLSDGAVIPETVRAALGAKTQPVFGWHEPLTGRRLGDGAGVRFPVGRVRVARRQCGRLAGRARGSAVPSCDRTRPEAWGELVSVPPCTDQGRPVRQCVSEPAGTVARGDPGTARGAGPTAARGTCRGARLPCRRGRGAGRLAARRQILETGRGADDRRARVRRSSAPFRAGMAGAQRRAARRGGGGYPGRTRPGPGGHGASMEPAGGLDHAPARRRILPAGWRSRPSRGSRDAPLGRAGGRRRGGECPRANPGRGSRALAGRGRAARARSRRRVLRDR